MTTQYRVCSGGGVLLNQAGKYHLAQPGEILSFDYADPRVIEDHLKSGHVVPVDSPSLIRRDEDRTMPPGAENVVPVVFENSKGNGSDPTKARINVVRTPPEPVPPVQVPVEAGRRRGRKTASPSDQPTSPWVMDPAVLEGKTLEELTIMALDRSPDGSDLPDGGFKSVKEAVSFLSRDFQA